MKSSIIIAGLCSLFILAACSSKDANAPSEAALSVLSTQSAIAGNSTTATVIPLDRKIIKDGEIAFATKNMKATEKFIKETINQFSGYISEEIIKSMDGVDNNIIEIKVPAQNFDLLLNAISANAEKLDRKDIRSEDVTEEYIDTEARIKSKLKLEERYFDLLKQSKSMDDILKMEAELSKVRNEIETAQGRINYINKRSAYSGLRIIYYEPQPETVVAIKPGFLTKFSHALNNGWQFLLQLFIALATIWPLLLIIIATGYFFVRIKRNREKPRGQVL